MTVMLLSTNDLGWAITRVMCGWVDPAWTAWPGAHVFPQLWSSKSTVQPKFTIHYITLHLRSPWTTYFCLLGPMNPPHSLIFNFFLRQKYVKALRPTTTAVPWYVHILEEYCKRFFRRNKNGTNGTRRSKSTFASSIFLYLKAKFNCFLEELRKDIEVDQNIEARKPLGPMLSK